MKTFYLSLLFIAGLLLISCSKDEEPPIKKIVPEKENFTVFTFPSKGVDVKGKIFLPSSHTTNSNLPAIYLIDYAEQHFRLILDEFDQVIKGVNEINNFDALVVTLEDLLDIDATPEEFQTYYDTFKDMTTYVDSIYTDNTSRTFIGRGSEAGVVLLTMLNEDAESSLFDNFIATDSPTTFNDVITNKFQNNQFAPNISNKKLHFSFSSSNNRTSCTRLINLIESKQYPWLTFKSEEYSMDTYDNAYTHSFAAGLKFVFL